MTSTTSAVAIAQIDLTTTDIDRSCAFYVDLLGLQLVVVLRQAGPPHHRHAVLRVGDSPSVLHLLERPSAPTSPSPKIGLLVPDLEALREVADRLQAAGASDGEVRFEGPTAAVTYRDPDGTEGDVRAPNLAFAPAPDDRCRVEAVGDGGPGGGRLGGP